jgi:signal transduction histidine kinase
MSLFASPERKIIIGSYFSEKETLKAFEAFQANLHSDFLTLQKEHQFNITARTSGHAYIIALEPFNSYEEAKNIKALLPQAFSNAFINKYVVPENESILAIQQAEAAEVIQSSEPLIPEVQEQPLEKEVEPIAAADSNETESIPDIAAVIEENITAEAPKPVSQELVSSPSPAQQAEAVPQQLHNNADLLSYVLSIIAVIFLLALMLQYRKNRHLQRLLEKSVSSCNAFIEEKNAFEQTLTSKDTFLENLTNSLKTPVDSIINASHALSHIPLERKEHDLLDAIILSSSKLNAIINNILDITKLRSDHLELEHVEFNLNQILETIAATVHKKAQEHNTELTFDIDTKLPVKFIGDPLRINQLMTNILNRSISNAEKGEVVIAIKELRRTPNEITLEFVFRDSGVGYKQEEIDTFFNDFADANVYDLDSNTKIGLVMSKQLINKMGGDIVLKSSYGHGSSFIFNITLELPKKLEQRKYRLPYKKIMDYSVLIIDNNVLAARVLRQQLEYFHLKVKPSFSWEHALKMLHNEFQHVDLLILNTTILAETSIEELAQVAEMKAFQIAFIVHDMRDINYQTIERFKSAHYLHKPYTQKKLIDLLVRVYESKLEDNS